MDYWFNYIDFSMISIGMKITCQQILSGEKLDI